MKVADEQLRGPATALLLGGLLLVLLAQLAFAAVPRPEQYGVLLFLLAGIVAFLLGGRLVVRGRAPAALVTGNRLARYLRLSPAQLLLLGLALCFALLAWLAAGRQLLARDPFVATAAWLLAVALVIAGSLERGAAPVRLARRTMWATAVLFGVALFLRAVAAAQIPTTFSGDEGSAGLFARMFLTGETDNLLSLGWFSFPALYFALQSVGLVIWGQTIEALRFGSALAGALTVVVVYWLGRSLFGRFTGWLAAVYLAASHYHIHMSRIGLNNVWDGLFAALALLGLWDGWKNGRRLSFVLCGLAVGLGQYFYVSIRVLPLLLLLWGLVAFLFRRDQFRARLPDLLLAGYVALIVFLPLGLLFAQHPDEFSAPMNRVTVLDDPLAGSERMALIGEQFVRSALGFTHEPLRLLYDPGAPLLLPLAAALFLLGLLWAVVNFDLRTLLILLPLLAVALSGALSEEAPAAQRYVLAMPFVALFVALPLAQLVAWLRQLWPRARRLVVVCAALLMLVLVTADLRYYFLQVYQAGYVLGDLNTRVATDVAYFLQDEATPGEKVYFFGFPRMGYYSLSTIPYLAPGPEGEDVADPLTAPPDWPLTGPTLFIFLPERTAEADWVRTAYPEGDYRTFTTAAGETLFTVYQVNGAP